MRKSTRFVAIAEDGRAPVLYGAIDSTDAAVAKLAGQVSRIGGFASVL